MGGVCRLYICTQNVVNPFAVSFENLRLFGIVVKAALNLLATGERLKRYSGIEPGVCRLHICTQNVVNPFAVSFENLRLFGLVVKAALNLLATGERLKRYSGLG